MNYSASSEHPDHPVAHALFGIDEGWRAAAPGPQTLQLVFDEPRPLRRIGLVFTERDVERTQEFVVSWRREGEDAFRPIVRQQWNFSPEGATRETENYDVSLPEVAALELRINPHIGGAAIASLTRLSLE